MDLPLCDECNDEIALDDLAPSCGAHRLHISCMGHFRCQWCEAEQGQEWEVPC